MISTVEQQPYWCAVRIDVENLPKVIVDFKKNLYLNLVKEIKLVIG